MRRVVCFCARSFRCVSTVLSARGFGLSLRFHCADCVRLLCRISQQKSTSIIRLSTSRPSPLSLRCCDALQGCGGGGSQPRRSSTPITGCGGTGGGRQATDYSCVHSCIFFDCSCIFDDRSAAATGRRLWLDPAAELDTQLLDAATGIGPAEVGGWWQVPAPRSPCWNDPRRNPLNQRGLDFPSDFRHCVDD